MVKIRLLKDTQLFKAGEIVEESKKNAEHDVDGGIAEYVKESKEEINIQEEEKPIEKIYKEIITQKEFFELLSSALGEPVLVWDGEGHSWTKDKRVYTDSKLLAEGKPVTDIVRFNGREMVFDLDSKDWNENKENGKKIKDFLEDIGIPYLLQVTGGKGMRFHIYFDKYSEMPQSRVFALYQIICKDLGLDYTKFGEPENKNLHKLVGTIGRPSPKEEYGHMYSTWLPDIPDERPSTDASSVRYPNEIKLWKIPDSLVEDAAAQEEENKKKQPMLEEIPILEDDVLNCKFLNHCIMTKLPEGGRNNIISKNLIPYVKNKADRDMLIERYLATQDMPLAEIQGWVAKGNSIQRNCGELINYQKKFLKDEELICKECEEYQKFKEEIADDKKKGKKDKDKKKEDDKDKPILTSCYIDIEKKIILEQVWDGKKSRFAVYNHNTKTIDYVDEYVIDGITYHPQIGEEILKNGVLLPSEAIEYGDDLSLNKTIYDFTYKWLDITPAMRKQAIWNIKKSWVYERYHTINYLRALADTGLGKTRYIDTLGYIHYKPILTSGATTAAPLFRIINKWHGSLIMDEADLKKTDEAQDIIKIINLGYEKGKHIMRCDQNDANLINFFDPFCPKILATRKPFDDKATESRCMTCQMGITSRTDLPPNLTDEFLKETLTIRNKLLMWRFRNYFEVDPNKGVGVDLGHLEPRVLQIANGFISLFTSEDELSHFKDYILKYQEELINERQNSFEGIVVGAIYDLINSGHKYFDSRDIVEAGRLTDNRNMTLKSEALKPTLKELGLGEAKQKWVDNKNKRVIVYKQEYLLKLFERYGFTESSKIMVLGIIKELLNTGFEKFTLDAIQERLTDDYTEDSLRIIFKWLNIKIDDDNVIVYSPDHLKKLFKKYNLLEKEDKKVEDEKDEFDTFIADGTLA